MSQQAAKVSREPSHLFRGVGDSVPLSVPSLVVFNPKFEARVRRERRREAEARRVAELRAANLAIAAIMPPWVKEIVADCCRRHGVTATELLSRSRRNPVKWCRFEVYYLLRTNERSPSLPRIGLWLDRDHTSVSHGILQWERRISRP